MFKVRKIIMSAVNFKSLGFDEAKNLLKSFDTIITDCDGVLWISRKPLTNSSEVIRKLKDLGKQIFYITNSDCVSRKSLTERLNRLGFPAEIDNALSAAYLAAYHIKHDLKLAKKAYVMGGDELTKELKNFEIDYIGTGPDIMPSSSSKVLSNFDTSEIGVVLVGWDSHLSVPKMWKSTRCLQDKNVHLVATNPDEQYLGADGIPIPGAGAFMKCIEACSNRKATVVGKPSTFAARLLNDKFKVDPDRTIMIGDRCDTDILFGKNCGFKTLLVLSGCTKLEDVEKLQLSDSEYDKKLVPDYYIDTLGDLLPFLDEI